MVDFEEKMNDIVSDYYSTIGKFNNISILLSLESYNINEDDSLETKKEKEGQKREILVDLGRVAEMAFKYLIKIRRMQLYPKELYNDTVVKGSIVKGFKDKETLSAGVIRELGQKVKASRNDIDEILNFSSVGPKAHDFSYLYLIIDKLMPDIRDLLNEIMSLRIKSINCVKVLSEYDYEYQEYIAFPNELLKESETIEGERKEIIKQIQKRNETIFHSGDIFTRLRYYSNNPFDKNYDVDEVYNMVLGIIDFIKIVHLYNETLDFNPEVAFSYGILNKYHNLSRFEFDEFKQIYMHEKIKDNPNIIMHAIFVSRLSLEEILEIINSEEINKEDYSIIFALSLNLETILYFRSIGINKYEKMQKELLRKNPDIDAKLYNLFSDERYTLQEYKKLRKKYNILEYPNILSLLDHLSENSIKKLNNQPKLLSFFTNEFYQLVNEKSYQYNDELFEKLIEIEELNDNYKAWYGLDIDQLEVYSAVSKLLTKDPLNDDIINQRNLSLDTIVENIKINVENYKDNPTMLCVMPLMLDYYETKEILDILIKNGLNINNLNGVDFTILCFPLKLVEVIEKIFKVNRIPLIVNNNVNPVVMKIIFMIKENYHSYTKIKERRVPYSIEPWRDFKSILKDNREEFFIPYTYRTKHYAKILDDSKGIKIS